MTFGPDALLRTKNKTGFKMLKTEPVMSNIDLIKDMHLHCSKVGS